MLPAERHARITDAVRSARVVSTEELAALTGASAETIRRDLMALELQGLLKRVHGGATSALASSSEEAPFQERSSANRDAKAAIGRAAAELVQPGQTVILDVGTSALEVARALPGTFRGTVATCSLLIAAELAGRSGVEVLVSGGRVRSGDLACSNAQTVAFFADLHADIAFLGSGGLDATAGLTDFHLDEIATRRVMLAHSAQSYVLVDSSKFGRVAPHRVCGLDAITGVVTDARPPKSLALHIERAGGVTVTG
ncbi:DeoR/GlpR transcriptional regulator [Planosporangium flavigriseum]|uniref:Lactose phosphotransferase system repressor n=1 Tax=Planosporangium flavigriseum TaxID=373681 RepID=A0A8J3M2Z3_9ACTN|nr:DeoR/GlpR family DNA-binding transcription regulator [Planosporangium flavigriseum]NJC65457.1 DeoR/GlpR transcriptional regulator [Planosporangium flavigriseum]GIG75855.1 GntR family transcriptional regulator [Planosporangium flavigriseum]